MQGFLAVADNNAAIKYIDLVYFTKCSIWLKSKRSRLQMDRIYHINI
jgi:hypothetical protein